MAEYENQLLVLDNKLKAREEEKKGSRNHMGQFVAPAPVSSFTLRGLAPMDLSATQWQNRNNTPRPPVEQRHYLVNGIRRITPGEKAWRRANGRCDFCGEAGHAFATCPKKQQPRHTMHGAALFSSPPPPAPQQLSPQGAPPPPAGFQSF